MVRNPTMSPMRGDRTMNSRILPRPWGRRTERREWVTAAPARPPMRACDDDTGSPSHQVSRFHAMAPTRPPRMTQRSMATGSTTPLPTVVATFTPKPNAATKLKRSEEHTSELQSLAYLVCRLLLEKKKVITGQPHPPFPD